MLRALRIVDTVPEPHFDALCRTAAVLFGTPIAIVSLVEDDRQWFKAQCGLTGTGSPRDTALCAHTILSDAVLVVEDATQDPRFARNPLVTGPPHIRFYAGAPLTLAPGIHVGSLCVIDTVPRRFAEAQRAQLRDLAEVVVAQLRLHAARQASEAEARERLRVEEALAERVAAYEAVLRSQTLAEAAAGIGHWRIAVAERRIAWSEGVARIFGQPMPPGGTLPLAEHLTCYHPEERAEQHARIEAIIADPERHRAGYRMQRRVVRPDGTVRRVVVHGAPEMDGATLTALYGVVLDMTDVVATEDQARETAQVLHTTLENMDQGLVMLDAGQRVRLFNPRARALLDLPAAVLHPGADFAQIRAFQRARGDFDRMPPAIAPEVSGSDLRRLPRIYEWPRPDGTTLEVRGVELPEGSFVYTFADVTARKRAEDAARDRERHYRLLAENATDIIIWSELDTTRRYVSPAAAAILGYAPEELVGTKPLDFTHPDDAAAYRRVLEDLGAGRVTRALTRQRYRHRDGRFVWLEVSFNLTLDPQSGRPDGYVATLRDVSDRKAVEEALSRSEERLALALEGGSDGFWDWDTATGQAWFSDRWYAMLGYTREAFAADVSAWRSLIHPEDEADTLARMRAHLKGETPAYESEFRLRRGDGAYAWVLVRGKVVGRDAAGRALRVVGTQIDIGRRKAVEVALSESEARYRTLADTLPQLVWIFAVESGEALYVNRGFERFYGPIGPSREARLARNHPEDAVRMEAAWQAAQSIGAPYRIEGRLRRHDGAYRWHRLVITPIRSAGAITAMLGTALDIDDIVAARQKLEETTNLLRLAQDSARAGTWQLDFATGRILWSAESARLHGLDVDGPYILDSDDWLGLVDRRDGPAALAAASRAAAARETLSTEFRVPLPDGSTRWISASGRPIQDAAGTITHMIGLNFDVTARKAAEAALLAASQAAEAARGEAERASAAKTEFLAAMSHEIRTPLNGVLGYTELLLDALSADAPARPYGERIRSAGSALLTVVDDILDFSKIEAGQIELCSAAFAPADLLEEAAAIVRASAEHKGLSLRVSGLAGLPARVEGDRDRLRQVLLNLVNNAVKFTSHGQVRLSAEVLEQTPESASLRFVVQDTGIGIPEAKRHRLFERFSQVDGSIQREFGGTGLGLAISKQLVNLMGGTIGVESTEGAGSEFWFALRLPVRAAAAEPGPEPERARAGAPRRLLLVEDVPLNQELALSVLRGAGHTVDLAESGPEAIAAVQAAAYDLVLMDVQMPGMDGMTATRRIRALAHPSRTVPIVAMTANVLPRQVAAFRAAGMDDHVGKPFRQAELLALIERWTGGQAEAASGSEAEGGLVDQEAFEDLRGALGSERTGQLLVTLAQELADRFGTDGAAPDPERLAHDAHVMVSAAGALGFTPFAELCREVETACLAPDGRPVADPDLVPNLAPALARLRRMRSAVIEAIEAGRVG